MEILHAVLECWKVQPTDSLQSCKAILSSTGPFKEHEQACGVPSAELNDVGWLMQPRPL